MKIPNGLSFQIKISIIDLLNLPISLSKIGDFIFSYYTTGAFFNASCINEIYTNCEVVGEEIVVTIDQPFDGKGVVKCRMEINVNDPLLPTQPFTFNCPEQRTEIEVI